MDEQHDRCLKESDWGSIKTKVEVVCKEQASQKHDIRELWDSLKRDFEKSDLAANKKFVSKTEFAQVRRFTSLFPDTHVTKKEFEQVKRIAYLFIALIVAQVIKGYFL